MTGAEIEAVGRERVLVDGLGFLEAPRWHANQLWFSDFYSRRVSSVDEAGVVTDRFYVPGQPSGLGLCADGSILISSMYDGKLLRGLPDGSVQVVADIGGSYRAPLGDLVVDSRGRAYVSTLPGMTAHASSGAPSCPIYLVDADGSVRVVAEGLQIPNGMAITPDGRSLIVAETRACRLLKLAIGVDGTLSAPVVFAQLGHRKPDGIWLDPCGAVWVASPFTSEVLLVAEGGEVLSTTTTPGSWAVACALGGADLDTLFVLTVKVTMDEFLHGTGKGAVRAYPIERR